MRLSDCKTDEEREILRQERKQYNAYRNAWKKEKYATDENFRNKEKEKQRKNYMKMKEAMKELNELKQREEQIKRVLEEDK